jgi:uncharacterized protein YicC (UPF0701 family)
MIIYIDKVARVAHEAQRAFLESIGDHTLTEWDKTYETQLMVANQREQKQNAENGVHMYLQQRQSELQGVDSVISQKLDALESSSNSVSKSAAAIFKAVVLAICEPRNASL